MDTVRLINDLIDRLAMGDLYATPINAHWYGQLREAIQCAEDGKPIPAKNFSVPLFDKTIRRGSYDKDGNETG